jgi:hypothetical protein
MMEDKKAAGIFLSAIIGEEIVELDFTSRKRTLRHPETAGTPRERRSREMFLTVCRFNFAAKIAVPGGFKTVIIELQKAKFASDIMRYRRFLEMYYIDEDNPVGSEDSRNARQIYSIFLIEDDVGIETPMIRIDGNSVKDVTTQEEVDVADNEFIRSLYHRSWIIQIGQLKQRRRNDIEKLLSIFDQETRTRSRYILNVDEDDFPEIYYPVIRRLRIAHENEEMKSAMEMEDDYFEELQDKDRLIAQQEKEIEALKKQLAESQKQKE